MFRPAVGNSLLLAAEMNLLADEILMVAGKIRLEEIPAQIAEKILDY